MSRQWMMRGSVAAVALSALCAAAGAVYAQENTPPAVQEPASVAARVGAAEEVPIQYTPIVVAEVFKGGVVRVVDDRTLIVHRDDKDCDETIRLFGVQALPALSPDGKSSAHDFLTDQLKNSKVRIEGHGRDKQGTLSAIVTPVPPPPSTHLRLAPDVTGVSGDHPYGAAGDIPRPPQSEKSLNETIVRLGLARYDAHQAPNEKELAAAEADARKGHKGYWAVPESTASSAEKP